MGSSGSMRGREDFFWHWRPQATMRYPSSVPALPSQIRHQGPDTGYRIVACGRQCQKKASRPRILPEEPKDPAYKEAADIEHNPSPRKLLPPFGLQPYFDHYDICRSMEQYEFHKRIWNRQGHGKAGKKRPCQRSQADPPVCCITSRHLAYNCKQDEIHCKIFQEKHVYVQLITHAPPSFFAYDQ